MLAVAAAMVSHTLKYRSQVVTGMAFFLAFGTITINRSPDVYSLYANAVLALALVVIVWRLRWFELEIFGILVAFLTHFYWLWPIVEKMGPHHVKFEGYTLSGALLMFYWLAFRVSYVIRRVESRREENISTLAALLNVGLLLGVSAYQSVHVPIHAFEFFLTVGAIELAFGQLPITRRRRTAFIVLTTIGATLLVAAFPNYATGASLSVLWLALAEAFFLVGVFTREIVFRRLGMTAALLLSVHMLGVDAGGVFRARLLGGEVASDPRLTLLFALAAVVFYLNSNVLAHRRPALIETGLEKRYFPWFSYLAGLFAGLAAWTAWPHEGAAVAWSALALATAWCGRRWSMRELSLQAHVFMAATFVRIPIVNLQTAPAHSHENWRLATVLASAVLLYIGSRYAGPAMEERKRGFAATYTWASSILLTLLGW